LDLEDYFKSVIANEMPIQFGIEAWKAHTVWWYCDAVCHLAFCLRNRFILPFCVCVVTDFYHLAFCLNDFT
jgi:hypothetical protein